MRSPTRIAVAIQLLGMTAAFPSSRLGIDLEVKARASDTYDYVIVGGGVTGLIVANRLTEDAKSGSLSSQRGSILTILRVCSCHRGRWSLRQP